MSVELRHEYATIDGVRMHWAQAGETQARAAQRSETRLGEARLGENGKQAARPPIVLLHGLTDSHLTWRAAAEELARDRLVLMPDLPGCGLSERPNASYELKWHAHMIALWLEHVSKLHQLDQVDFVGHSFGGGVAQMLLLECPERIRRIVLVAAGGLGRDVGFWLKLATFPHFVERYGQPFMAFGTRRALGRARHAQDARGQEDVAALSAMNAERGTARAFSRTVRDVINFGGQTRHFLQRAHEVATFPPTLVLWGERDTLIPIAHGRAFVERMEGAQLKAFKGCGHYLHQEEPEAFVTAVRDFLDSPDAAPLRLLPPAVFERPVATLARKAMHALARRTRRAQSTTRGLRQG